MSHRLPKIAALLALITLATSAGCPDGDGKTRIRVVVDGSGLPAERLGQVTTICYRVDGDGEARTETFPIADAFSDGQYEFDYYPTIEAGIIKIGVEAKDVRGNVIASDEVEAEVAKGHDSTAMVNFMGGDDGGVDAELFMDVADMTPPDTTISNGPPATVGTSSVTLTFESNERGLFECRLDTGAWSPCASPHLLKMLSDGLHTFEVRAVDDAGNRDASPAFRTFKVDTTAPDTTITMGPSGPVGSVNASFEFSATETGASFRCSVDGAAAAACPTPHTLNNLAPGNHSISVAAVDLAGNVDASPAVRDWAIVDEDRPHPQPPEATPRPPVPERRAGEPAPAAAIALRVPPVRAS